eukprot:5975201-Amphidinium_carterae.1
MTVRHEKHLTNNVPRTNKIVLNNLTDFWYFALEFALVLSALRVCCQAVELGSRELSQMLVSQAQHASAEPLS